MATVKPPVIERPKKSGRNRENIHDLDDNMAEHSIAPQVYGVQTSQEPVIPNPLESRPAIDIIQSMSLLQSDGTDDKYLLPTQQTIYAEADDSSRYFPVWASDVRTHQLSKFQTIIEMFPPGSICKIYLPDIDPYWAIINKTEFSTTHLEPALYIEFFKIEDILRCRTRHHQTRYLNIQSYRVASFIFQNRLKASIHQTLLRCPGNSSRMR